ncbi:class I SAM-dependent DNA methyltransferase [Streptomyces sp. NPDC049099]|uniref:type I restriction-modification system subunit M n=1 Tax=Streptomyces sp. NPDC049099 TaxID=3155768 RepID=UPI00343EB02D
MTITLPQLESRLWEAANALRGPVDPADFKTYVFPMLFWKWLSDTWVYNHSQAVERWGGSLTPAIEADYHPFIMPENSLWAEVTKKTGGVLGSNIAQALDRIERANPKTLARIFGDASWGDQERLPEQALVNMIKAFNSITLNPATVDNDLLGAGYEYLLKQFADESGKKAGEFFTPREVVNLVIGLLDPQPGESVYDPSCGSGGMLISTISRVETEGKDSRTLRLYGQEVNLTTSAIARMNLFLHDIEDFDIKRGDTLADPKFKNTDGSLRQFDVVVANPPFSLSPWARDDWASDPRAATGLPPANSADYAFIQHMIASMKPGTGRVGVVMPLGVLFRGSAEGKIRQKLVEADLLEAVIGLPKDLFYNTGIPTCILIFRAPPKPEERKGKVLFVDASARFVPGKNRNSMSDKDVRAVLEAMRIGDAPNGEDGVAVRLVDFAEIKDNGFDLSITKYIKRAAEERATLDATLADYRFARQSRLDAEKNMRNVLSEIGVNL